MKILVIGGTGHVGSEVVKELKKRDADVRVLVRKPDVKSLPGVEVVVGDLLDPVSIDKALQGGWPMMMHKLSQGASFQDPAALGRLKYAVAAGLCLGGYHFMTADPVSSQVANFMHMAGQAKQLITPAPLMLCIDNEPAGLRG